MSDIIVSAENLSKSYLVGHQSFGRARKMTLRDVINREARDLARKAVDFIHSRPIVQGDEVEEFWALRDVSFEVRRGEVLGVIGRNGAGKSTLLKILSRITEPTHGRAILRGRVASLLEVGTGFHQELTGRENIFLNGAILGMGRFEIARKFDEIVAFAGVERFLDTPVKRYSSGMYMRLAFAVAAHLEPEILVVDEVLAVGDAEFQRKCIGRMSDISTKEGRTILFISHNMSAVERLCQKGICLEDGRIIHKGEIRDTIACYLGRVSKQSFVSFQAKPGQPSITGVKIDEDELKLGNLIIDIDFVLPFELAPLVPGVVVYSETGMPVWGTNPLFHNRASPPQLANGGTVRMEAKALPLAPGNYLLSVWLSDDRVDYDHKSDVLSFDFRPGASDMARSPSDEVGHLDWSADWRTL
jgi:lipopolysaccharide transport system ATP-binding protein